LGKWTPEEYTKLIEAVKNHGTNWVAVAALVPGRTNDQCRQRWMLSLDPDIGKSLGKWTPEEDTKLIEAEKKHGTNWVAVAALVPGRTNNQCRQRWMLSMDPDIGKSSGKWTPEEDTKLIEAVTNHSTNWVAVSALVPGRTNRQCRSRWTLCLDPDIGKSSGKWTPEEDTKLIEAVKNHGQNWVVVADHVPGRANQQCRKRWTSSLDPDRASNTVEKDPDCQQ
jgi:myb proto-oncogene protein